MAAPTAGGAQLMKINLASIFVDDQAKALAFYTELLVSNPRTTCPWGRPVG